MKLKMRGKTVDLSELTREELCEIKLTLQWDRSELRAKINDAQNASGDVDRERLGRLRDAMLITGRQMKAVDIFLSKFKSDLDAMREEKRKSRAESIPHLFIDVAEAILDPETFKRILDEARLLHDERYQTEEENTHAL